MDYTLASEKIRQIKENIKKAFIGRDEVIDLVLAALIADGNILLEDVPGVGKTLLARSVAKSISCDFKRIQFTPDLLPSDISGINYYNQKEGEFVFRPGPVFANIILADEINRATPRTQSALLECMQEKQVTVDGVTMPLSQPFMVIATQNPIETQGTFPLPEAQLDRFLMKIRIGYPETADAVEILKRYKASSPEQEVKPVVTGSEVTEMQTLCRNVHVNADIFGYIIAICEATRKHEEVLLGASPRASQALLRASQAAALLDGRDYLIPDDVKYMAMHVLPHRIILRTLSKIRFDETLRIISNIVETVEVPTEPLDLGTGE